MPAHEPPADTTPPPIPLEGGRVDPSIKTIVVMGGSFDPPHKGHVHLPLMAVQHLERIRQEPRGVWLLYVPAARSPHKTSGPTAGDAQRVEMLRLATGYLPRCGVWTDEIDRTAQGGASFTVDTLRRLRDWLDSHAGESIALRLLIGQDQAATFVRWREPDEITRLAPPLVLTRPGASAGEHGLPVAPVGTLDVSSTVIREALARGDDAPASRLLDTQVLEFIQAHHVYAGT